MQAHPDLLITGSLPPFKEVAVLWARIAATPRACVASYISMPAPTLPGQLAGITRPLNFVCRKSFMSWEVRILYSFCTRGSSFISAFTARTL